MLFCHIVDDYYLQGVLAKMKQRKWWRDNNSDIRYINDYRAALLAHSFSWSFMIHLPMVAAMLINGMTLPYQMLITFFINVLFHYAVDNEKANRYSINLIVDQTIHFFQVTATWLIIIITCL